MIPQLAHLGALDWTFAVLVAVAAGVVKGAVGFGMPLIFISGLSVIMPPDLALAALILPTLATNGVQALRQGRAGAMATIRRFRLFLIAGGVMLALSAQMVSLIDPALMFLLIGLPVVGFAAMHLVGWQPRLPAATAPWEIAIGGLSGFLGGFSGVWGPPTVAWLTALRLDRDQSLRAQGVIYGLGAAALFAAHLASGLLRAPTLLLSAAMVLPAFAGLRIGMALSDRASPRVFLRATLVVLLLAGMNLIRRGLAG